MDSSSLEVTVSEKINYACQQNAFPLIRDLSIVNNGERDWQELRLELTSNPPFFTSKIWRLDLLRAGGTLHVSDRDVRLDGHYLASVTEALRSDLTFTLYHEEEVLIEESRVVELLARNEWGGGQFMPELLAAFIEPNQSFVSEILRSASQLLQSSGLSGNLEGYQSQSPKRVGEIVSALWSAVSNLGITYAEPPASFEQQGQKIRLPALIKESGLATCLDLTLLFASLLEQAGLNPLVILVDGHAFPGVWLHSESFNSVTTEEASTVRKRIDLQELLVFESTLVTNGGNPAPFSQAIAQGKARLQDDDGFRMAIDVRRARMHQIRPLAMGDSESREDQLSAGNTGQTGLDLLDLPEQGTTLLEEEEKPATPSGRLHLWQKKLLDLSLRNKLLNFKLGASAIKLICPDPGLLEDKLTQKKKLRIDPLPNLGLSKQGRDAEIHTARSGTDLIEELASRALEKNQVYSPMEKESLDKVLVSLFRKSKTDMEEGGANTLFLVVGFLSWCRSDDKEKKYRAPLILIPVTLERKSVQSGVRMILHDDEPRFNTTLLQMLRQDFQLEISGLEGDLPTDDYGVDVSGIWQTVRKHVRDVEGFEVLEEVALSNFSFAKYLMWKDLVDRSETLKENRVVRHLLETPQETFSSESSFRQPDRLDDEIPPEKLLTPLPADSSQQAAVVASSEGKDFVLIGPPGTGKSQTIANMIAHNLGLGRSVLFVSEKAAALDVVYRRLKEQGLGEFCLELHSNKSRKMEVLNQFRQAWTAKDSLSQDTWQREANRLRVAREGLNGYVRAIHRPGRHGMTPYHAIGLELLHADTPVIEISFARGDIHDRSEYEQLLDLSRKLYLYAKELGGVASHPLAFVHQDDWTPQWQRELLNTTQRLVKSAASLREAATDLFKQFGLSGESVSWSFSVHLPELIESFQAFYQKDGAFVLQPNASQILQQFEEGVQTIRAFEACEAQLSCPYPREKLLSLDTDSLQAQWQEAEHSWWLGAWFKRRAVRKALTSLGGAVDKPSPENDLSIIAEMQRQEKSLQKLDAVAGISLWQGLDSELEAGEVLVKAGQRVIGVIQRLAPDPDAYRELHGICKKWIVEGNELLSPDGRLAVLAGRVTELHVDFLEVSAAFQQLIGDNDNREETRELFFNNAPHFADILNRYESVLNPWCRWQSVRKKSCSLGLTELVDAMEQGKFGLGDTERVFKVNYARWWSRRIFEDDPVLRKFSSVEQEDKIRIFKQVDERFAELTRHFIRARQGSRVPGQEDVSRKSEFGVLRRELEKKMRHKPVRQLFNEIPNVINLLTPCLLMSPLSIAQYLPAEKERFDLVIFDEASQITVWDAVGSLARGNQVVVAGDPKQLPPTNFFGRRESEGDEVDEVGDLESILDEMLGCSIPQWHLDWHYRSEHESLIAFSNLRYYQNRLITFPSPVTEDRALRLVPVTGHYDRGGSRTNKAEAEAVVSEVVRRLNDSHFSGSGKTIGVVTFNSEQQKLIEDLLDVARNEDPSIEPHFADSKVEPVFVKNLESVQGDERDLILFSITYGPDSAGHMTMNFGPLNKQGGERRLNVAITRARSELIVFATVKPEQIDLARTQAAGARDLKHFLEYAQRGSQALEAVNRGSVGEFESPFEEAVSEALKGRGWIVHPQIGVSAFRVDLGIVHPEHPGRYFIGIECDGATYHSSATARDRDKVREAILGRLGWRLIRVWSLDWWMNPGGTTDKLDQRIRAELENANLEIEREDAARREAEEIFQKLKESQADADLEPDAESDFPENDSELVTEESVKTVEVEFSKKVAGFSPPVVESINRYQVANFESLDLQIDSNLFHDPVYTPTLKKMVFEVLDKESPIRSDVLVRRIARAHGFKRSGRLITERLLDLASERSEITEEEVGQFLWKQGLDPLNWGEIRYPTGNNEDDRRVEEIPIIELVALAGLFQGSSSIVEDMATALGIRRLASSTRKRLEMAVDASMPSEEAEKLTVND